MKKWKRIYWLLFALLLLIPVRGKAESTGVVYNDSKGSNSWWIYPLSVDSGNYTYTSYTYDGYSGIQQYNHRTGKVKRVNLVKFSEDDHNAGAIEFLDDGRLIYAVTGHNSAKYLYVFVQKEEGDITKWKRKKLTTKGMATYAQIIKNANGYYLFTRGRIPSYETPEEEGFRGYWSVFYSKDGQSWSSEKYVIDRGSTAYYLMARACIGSDKIRLVMYSHPKKTDSDIRLAYLDTNTMRVVDEKGNNLYKVRGSGYGLPYSEVPIIVSKGTNQRQRLLDVATTKEGITAVAYATFTDASNAVYHCAIHSSKTGKTKVIQLVDSGEAFLAKTFYFGGMVFSAKSTSTLYLSRKVGDIWRIERWKKRNGEYYFDKLISKSRQNLIRPFVSKNKNILQWEKGYYDSSVFKKADTVISRSLSKS